MTKRAINKAIAEFYKWKELTFHLDDFLQDYE
jgi:hypothetical protein